MLTAEKLLTVKQLIESDDTIELTEEHVIDMIGFMYHLGFSENEIQDHVNKILEKGKNK
jgi:hypothetical protein